MTDDLAAVVRGIWTEQLNATRIGDDDDYFFLGGSSLGAAIMVARIRQAVGRDLGLVDVFECRTLGALVARIGEVPPIGERDEPAAERVDRGGPVRASMEQERLLELLAHSPTVIAVHSAYRIRGPLDVLRLQAALDQLTARHELLRSTVHLGPDGAHLRAHPDARLRLRIGEVTGVVGEPTMAALSDLVAAEGARPIDRAAAPLARCTLYPLAPDDHVLVLVLDHIITDGQSSGILIEELGTLYAGLGRDPGFRLPPVEYDFGDWAHWQRRTLAGDRSAALVDRWRDRLGPDPSVTATVFPGYAAQPQEKAGGLRLPLPPEVTEALRRDAAELRVTLFSLLLTGLLGALSARTGQTSFVVSTSLGNRTNPAFERVFGPVSHDAYIRVDLLAAEPGPAMATNVQRAVEETLSHGEMPLTALWERLWPDADEELVTAPALYFVLNAGWDGHLELDGTNVETIPNPPQMPMPGLECTANEEDGTIVLYVGYLAGSLSPELVAALAEEWVQAARACAAPLRAR